MFISSKRKIENRRLNKWIITVHHKFIGLFFFSLLNSCFAFSSTDIWYTHDQQGAQAFANNDMQRATKLFENSNWKASAAYRSGDYAQALANFKRDNSSNAYYNQGNALAHLQKYQEAINAYDTALKLDQNNKDAEYNRDIVKQLLAQQKQADKNSDQQDKQNKDPAPPENKNNAEQNQAKKDQTQKNQDEQQKKSANQQNESVAKQAEQEANKQDEQAQAKNQAAQDQQPQTEQGSNKAEQAKAAQAKQDEQQKQRVAQTSKAEESSTDKATKQWLGQLHDEPGGLLRQKFLRDHQRMQNEK